MCRTWTGQASTAPLPLYRTVRRGAEAFYPYYPTSKPLNTQCFAARATESLSVAQESSHGAQVQSDQAGPPSAEKLANLAVHMPMLAGLEGSNSAIHVLHLCAVSATTGRWSRQPSSLACFIPLLRCSWDPRTRPHNQGLHDVSYRPQYERRQARSRQSRWCSMQKSTWPQP